MVRSSTETQAKGDLLNNMCSPQLQYMREEIIDPKYHWRDHAFEWFAYYGSIYWQEMKPHLAKAMR